MKIPPVAADLFRAVAPVLGLALGGPLGGTVAAVAVKALDAWIVPRDGRAPTPEDVVAAVEKNAGNPQLALDLARAELAIKDYELRMRKVNAAFSLTKLEFQDRGDARAFVRDTGSVSFSQRLGLALLIQDAVTTLVVLAGAFVLMTGLFAIGDPNVFAALIGFVGVVLGRISTRADTYINFIFGGSASSDKQSDQIGAAVQDLGQALADRPAPLALPPLAPQPLVIHNAMATAPDAQDGPWLQGPHGGQRWRLTAAGVVLEGETQPLRTVGQPATVRRIWRDFGHLVAASCARNGVPLELVVACIAVESRGRADAIRTEPDGRQSAGLMQTLTTTAAEMMGGPVTAQDLLDPALSIEAGVRYLAKKREVTKNFQPPLLAVAYNSGGIYSARAGDNNPFNLRSTGDHAVRFCRYFGDACAVAAEDGWSHAPAGKETA